MILKTTLFGKTYQFADVKEVLNKAGEHRSGDVLAGAQHPVERDRWIGQFLGDARVSAVIELDQRTADAAAAEAKK